MAEKMRLSEMEASQLLNEKLNAIFSAEQHEECARILRAQERIPGMTALSQGAHIRLAGRFRQFAKEIEAELDWREKANG